MDQKTLLTTTRLTLAADLKAGPKDDNVIPLKNIPYKTYLTVTPRQWEILNRFKEEKSVSEVLPSLILDRKCPSLSSLYELILKAFHSGVLLTDNPDLKVTPAEVKATDWPLKIKPSLLTPVAIVCVLFGIGSAFWNGIHLPHDPLPIAMGWIYACMSLSLGNILAASIFRSKNAEIYNPRLNWKSLIPHFDFDRSDIIMMPRGTRRATSLARVAPLFLTLGFAAIYYPPMIYSLILGIFYITDPIKSNPATDFIRACYKGLRLSTSDDFLFVQNRLFWTLLYRKIAIENKAFYLAYALYTFCWLFVVYTLHERLFNIQGMELVKNFYTTKELHLPSSSMAGMTLGMMLLASGATFWLLLKNIQTLVQRKKKRNAIQFQHKDLLADENKETILSSTLLFQKAQLAPETFKEIAHRAEVIQCKKKELIIEEGAPGSSLYVIALGEVEVQRKNASGRATSVGRLSQLDVFGERALLKSIPRTRSVIAKSKTTLLKIGIEDFQRYLVSHVGAEAIETILEKEAFLDRLEFTDSWPPQALRRFTELSTKCTVKAGQKFLQKGQENQCFYLVYEGVFEVKSGKKRLQKLVAGDFFGEISLLQNSAISADIYAVEDSKCFLLHKNDFLRFISEDYIISLFFEKVSSDRLHAPIFPLKGRSFDCR